MDVEDEGSSWTVAAGSVAKCVAVYWPHHSAWIDTRAQAGVKEGLPHPSPVSASPSRRLDVGGVTVPDSEAEDKIYKKHVS
jgi:hypothetical protein